MKKKIIAVGVCAGILMAIVVVVYAITNLFDTKTSTTEYSKKVIFEADLDIGMSTGEVGPGDCIMVNPIVTNSATEEMYVFLKIQIPEWDGSPLYTFQEDDQWQLIESADGTTVYAYGNPEMTILYPGESTSALTNQMMMQSISNAEYAAIDDINIMVTCYAIGTEDVATNPVDAWIECKTIGNIQ